MSFARIMNRRRDVQKARAALDHLESMFRRKPGGTTNASARADAERWAYELALCGDDAFCREKASFIIAYSEDYFSDTRHARYGVPGSPGLCILRDRIFATIAAMRARLDAMESTREPTRLRLQAPELPHLELGRWPLGRKTR
jgi:hypothetical protein